VRILERFRRARFDAQLSRMSRFYLSTAAEDESARNSLRAKLRESDWSGLSVRELVAWNRTRKQFGIDSRNMALRSLFIADLAASLDFAPDTLFDRLCREWMLESSVIPMSKTIGRLALIPGLMSSLRDVALGCRLGIAALEERYSHVVPAAPKAWEEVQLTVVARWTERAPFPADAILRAGDSWERDELEERWQALTGITIEHLRRELSLSASKVVG
jgi:hypothetical protein